MDGQHFVPVCRIGVVDPGPEDLLLLLVGKATEFG